MDQDQIIDVRLYISLTNLKMYRKFRVYKIKRESLKSI
jgi:hypothetical protein